MIKIVLFLYVSILAHEFGHFICAKILKLRVLSFAVFMYPVFFMFFRGTLFKIGFVPVTGYTNAPDIYQQKKYKKVLYFSSGVFMNWILFLATNDIVLTTINAYLILFNLIPFAKSDGRNILESL